MAKSETDATTSMKNGSLEMGTALVAKGHLIVGRTIRCRSRPEEGIVREVGFTQRWVEGFGIKVYVEVSWIAYKTEGTNLVRRIEHPDFKDWYLCET